MKFLLDQSADFRLIPHLRKLGHDVAVISRNYPHGFADEQVLEIARKEKRILIVADRDFGELIFHQGLAHEGVIFFRLPGANLQTKMINSMPCSRSTLMILSAAGRFTLDGVSRLGRKAVVGTEKT